MRWALSFALLATLVAAAPAAEAADVRFELSIAVVDVDGKPVRDDAWVSAQVAQAERLFGQFGVHFKTAVVRALDARFAHLETRADRDALAAELEPKRINVMLVESLRDVDDTSLFRQGVLWRPASTPNKHYAIISSVAQPTTLAHELGHLFGNAHVATMNNLMSYARTPGEVFLDAEQGAKIKVFAGIFVRSKELRVDAP